MMDAGRHYISNVQANETLLCYASNKRNVGTRKKLYTSKTRED